MRKINLIAVVDIMSLLGVGIAAYMFGRAFFQVDSHFDLIWKGCYFLQFGFYGFFLTNKMDLTWFLFGLGASTSVKAIIQPSVEYSLAIVAADIVVFVLLFFMSKVVDLLID